MRKITYKPVSEELKNMAMPGFNSTRSSLGNDKNIGEYFYIPTTNLLPFKNQARKLFSEEELESLAQSIKEHGIRQPLTILPSDIQKGKYEVISGERRLRAAKLINLETVPCIIIHDKKKAEEIAIIENIHRENLHPIELGAAYKHLLEANPVMTKSELAKKLSVPESSITEFLSYSNLEEWVKKYLIENGIKSRDILRKIIKQENNVAKIEKILGIQQDTKTSKSFSVLRIEYRDENFKFQTSGLKKLDPSLKKTLKKGLLALIQELE